MLTAVLWLYRSAGGIDALVVGTVEMARRTWIERESDVTAGCIDVSFGVVQPPDVLRYQQAGRPTLYVTARAALVLAHHVHLVPATPATLAASGLLYAIDGWDAPTSRAIPMRDNVEDDWVQSYLEAWETDKLLFEQAGIRDEATYVINEGQLPLLARVRSSRYRFRIQDNGQMSYDSLRKIIPPWLREQRINLAILPVRIRNVFIKHEYLYWWQVFEQTEAQLQRHPNFGRTSVEQLSILLRQIASGKQYHDLEIDGSPVLWLRPDANEEVLRPEHVADVKEFASFFEVFQSILRQELTEREQDILTKYIGYRTNSQTLDQIGSSLNLTRERIRQLYHRCASRFRTNAVARFYILERLERLVHDSADEVPIAELHLRDPWFGEQLSQRMLSFFVDDVWDGRIRIAGRGQEAVLLPWSQQMPEELTTELRAVLLDLATERVPVEDIEPRVLEQYSDVHPAVVRYAIKQSGPRLQIATDHSTGNRYLVGFGRTLDDRIRAILEDSPEPMTCAEIESELIQRGYDYAISSIQGRTNHIAIRCRPGYFGLRHHISLSDEQIHELEHHVTSVLAGDRDRQWHFDEVKEKLEGVYSIDSLGLDSYAIIDLLDFHDMVTKVGYHSLRYRYPGDGENPPRRLKIVATTEAILEEQGSPMEISALRDALRERRGISEFQQIFYAGRIIGLRRGLVGLIDRDLGIPPEVFSNLLAQLREIHEHQGIELRSKEAVSLARQMIGEQLDQLDDASVASVIWRLYQGRLNVGV